MSLEAYWLMVPLIGIGLCAVGGFGCGFTHPKRHAVHQPLKT